MLPRGIRNNNPLNIRIGNAWKGEVENPTDSEFEQFTSLRWGLRAGFILLKRYIIRYKLNTIKNIISRWAPQTENQTDLYIKKVSSFCDCPADEPISFYNETMMCNLVQAMCLVECACLISRNEILEAYHMTDIWRSHEI